MNDLDRLDKEVREEVERALARGWTARWTANGHVLLRHPNGRRAATIAPRAGSPRGLRNVRSALKEDSGDDAVGG